MVYDYVVMDTKLLVYGSYYRHEPITNFLNIIMRALIFNKIKYKKFVFAHDINKSKHRLDRYPDYKGHRKEVQNRDPDSEQSRRDEFIAQYKRLPTILKYIGLQPNISIGLEADDVPIILSEIEPDAKILCITLDFDWLFHVYRHSNISLLLYDRNKLVTSANLNEYTMEKYMLSIDELYNMSMIMRQKKDNIPGITNISYKRWGKYFAGMSYEAQLLQVQEWIDKGKFGAAYSDERVTTLADSVELTTMLMSPITYDMLPVEEQDRFTHAIKGDDVEPKISYREWLELSLMELSEIPPMTEEMFTALQNSIHREL